MGRQRVSVLSVETSLSVARGISEKRHQTTLHDFPCLRASRRPSLEPSKGLGGWRRVGMCRSARFKQTIVITAGHEVGCLRTRPAFGASLSRTVVRNIRPGQTPTPGAGVARDTLCSGCTTTQYSMPHARAP